MTTRNVRLDSGRYATKYYFQKILIHTFYFQKQFLTCCLVYLVIVNGMKCLVRNQDWRTEESIFLAGLRVSHTNAKLWNNVGHALESRKAYSQALTFFQQATSGNLLKGIVNFSSAA